MRKEFHHDSALQMMIREARLMLELNWDGRGAAPPDHGLSAHTINQEFISECYDKFLLQCYVDSMLCFGTSSSATEIWWNAHKRSILNKSSCCGASYEYGSPVHGRWGTCQGRP